MSPGLAERAASTVQLRDGREVVVRPIAEDDGERLLRFHESLSPETVRLRFFAPHPRLSRTEVHRFTHVDGDQRLALVAVADGEIVGVGRYETTDEPDEVEVAFVLRDDFQGVGLGSALLDGIVAGAVAHGKRRLVASVLPENRAMRRTFRHLGPGVHEVHDGGVLEVSAPLGRPA